LEEAGVSTERGRIIVNDKMETNVKGVYAIGDVVGGVMLAHVASREGIVAVQNCLGKETRIDYRVVPSCIFTQPEVASIGLKEEEAKDKGYEIKIGRFPYSASGKAVCMGEGEGFVKIVADAKNDQVLGAHAIGPHVTDLIAELALAMQYGITTTQIADTIHAHPTLSESLMEAAEAVDNLAIHAM
jgi:dihydrolipoamide dehydrogenase